MSELIKQHFTPPGAEVFSAYLRPDTKLPPLKTHLLRLDFLDREESLELDTPVPDNSNSSLALLYKSREAVVSGLNTQGEQLSVLQLQGAYQEGYRVNTSLDWISLFADQIVLIASHPDTNVRRLIMPTLTAIQGLLDAKDNAMKRYEIFAKRAGLVYSAEEVLYVRDITRS